MDNMDDHEETEEIYVTCTWRTTQREIGKLEGEVASLKSQIQFMLSQKNGSEGGSD